MPLAVTQKKGPRTSPGSRPLSRNDLREGSGARLRVGKVGDGQRQTKEVSEVRVQAVGCLGAGWIGTELGLEVMFKEGEKNDASRERRSAASADGSGQAA